MRIISLSPSTTEILFALNAGDMIVANTYFCDYPSEAKKLPKAGSFSNIDFEKIKKFKPDLVITSTIVQKRINLELQKKGFRTVYLDPRSLTDILSSIKQIGKLIGREKESSKVIKKMQKEIVRLKKTKPSKKPRVYIEEWYEPPMYSGNWVPDIVELAGGTYGLATKGGISKNTPEKKLFAFDPEYIFVSYCGFGRKSDPNRILKRKGWENITAVKSKKVYPLDETILNRPGPRILKAAKEIQNYLKL